MKREQVLRSWQKNESARGKWAEFLASKEFEAGLEVLKAQAQPVIYVGEPSRAAAQRQHFQAGYAICIDMLEGLPEIHFKGNQDKLPEWGDLEQDEE